MWWLNVRFLGLVYLMQAVIDHLTHWKTPRGSILAPPAGFGVPRLALHKMRQAVDESCGAECGRPPDNCERRRALQTGCIGSRHGLFSDLPTSSAYYEYLEATDNETAECCYNVPWRLVNQIDHIGRPR
jgi:hypothetical protein